MSWCWGTTKWEEQEDGTFHFSIPDKDIREQYRLDTIVGAGFFTIPGYELLEDMHSNSLYEYTDPVSIMVRCVALKSFDIFAYWRKVNTLSPWQHLYHNRANAPKEAIVVGLPSETKLIADFDTNDDGDITKVNKLWILPEGWVEKVLEGETIICKPYKMEVTK